LAIENCIDIAAHIISEEGYGMPGSASDMFYLLEDNSYIRANLTEKTPKGVTSYAQFKKLGLIYL